MKTAVSSPLSSVLCCKNVCEVLQYLHEEGVVHRDLKPHNIMVGCEGSLRLLDLGLAASVEAISAEHSGATLHLGSPDYMPPEQVEGKPSDARSDLYSLGAMLYEMLTGRVPFDGDNPLAVMNARLFLQPDSPSLVNPLVSYRSAKLVLRSLQRRARCRFQSAKAMGLAVRKAVTLRERATNGRAPGLQGFLARHPWWVFGVALPTVLQATVALTWMLRVGH